MLNSVFEHKVQVCFDFSKIIIKFGKEINK